MQIIDEIRDNIKMLYETNPNVHVSIETKSPRKTSLNNVPALIKGVYPHMFMIEDKSSDTSKIYTHNYTEIITKDIQIQELTCNIEQNIDIGRKRK